jgi:hypothetical protein
MESPKIVLPKDKIFKVHFLNSNGNTKQIYVFSKNIKTDIFSESEWKEIQEKKIEVKYCESQIHKDDSVRIIKKKIIHEYGINKVSYDEMYLFLNNKININVMQLYQSITNNESSPFTYEKMKQLYLNININPSSIEIKESYSYDDLLQIFQEGNIYSLNIPFGQKFSDKYDFLFSANPFHLFSNNTGIIDFDKHMLLSIENLLLLNYGNIENNIYVCLVEDVLKYTNVLDIDSEYIVQTYFPFLYKKSIITLDEFQDQKQVLIKDNKNILNTQTLSFYKTIDIFYDIYNSRGDNELFYLNRGIKDFQIKIKSDMMNTLPLEVIFKNIHSTKDIPFIKYNPGNRRENIYRLYSEKKTRDGKNIPYLSESMIIKLSKEIGKSKQISFFIYHVIDEYPINIFINVENNGDVVISSELKKPIKIDELTNMLQTVVNPVINNINQFVEQTGYKIRSLKSLTESYIEIVNIKYTSEFILEKELNFGKYTGCISSIFDVIRDDDNTGTFMRFKRVENFQEMDAQTLLIRDAFTKTNDITDIIQILVKNYKMTTDAAELRIVQYLGEHKDIQGKAIDNPGFPVLFKISKLDKKLYMEVDDIISIDYLETIYIYLDSILRMTQYPDTTSISKKDILSVCSKADKLDKNVDKSHIENIVSTVILKDKKIEPLKFIEAIEEEEEDEDYEKGIMYDEDEDYEAAPEIESNKKDESVESVEENEPIKKVESVESDESVEENEPIKKDESVESSESPSSEEGIFFDESTSKSLESTPKSSESNLSEERSIRPKREIKGGVFPFSGGDTNSYSSTPEKEFIINPTGIKLKDPSYFYVRMKQRDPILFATEEDPNYEGYSRICQSSQGIQPVVLNEKEFEKINNEFPGSYSDYVKYGSNPENAYYYICPRYWCLSSNASMTEEDVKQGKCAKIPDPKNPGKFLPDKIIDRNAKIVPKDAFVYEFNNPKEHMKDGKYVTHYPGFKADKHPKGFALPCCFKKPKQNWEYNLAEQKKKRGPQPQKKAKRIDESDKNIYYIISNETFPIKEHRFGFLPLSIQRFLQTDNNRCVTENNPAVIKENTNCLLRYGVEQLQNQSILGSLAEIYAHTQGLKTTPSVKELKDIMVKSITIDKFIKYNNSYLISVFKPKKINMEEIDISKYQNTEFYKSIDTNNEFQNDFLEDTIASYENFLKFIQSDNEIIDHVYLWDIITDDNDQFIKGGINLVILEIPNNDITDNIKVICPTNSQSRLYDPRKETVILIKRDEFYEPIYMYNEMNGEIRKQRTFFEQTAMTNIKKILNIIQKTTNKKCSSQPSLPKIYKFSKNITIDNLYLLLKTMDYLIESQIMNYQGKIVGLITKQNDTSEHVYVPCFPSTIREEMNDIPVKYITDDNIWNSYQNTVEELKKIYGLSKGKIPCKPRYKILEDNLIIGIITDTNQFVQLNPPSENIIIDDLPIINSSNYIIADNIITTTKNIDNERELMIKKIKLESQFYSLFRSIIRGLLNKYENRELRSKIIALFENENILYRQKLSYMMKYLKQLVGDHVLFQEISEEVLMKFEKINCSLSNCGEQEFCIKKKGGYCQIIIPIRHLISGYNNEDIYFNRIADELIRYKRIRLFMIQPKTYLNITNTDYNVNNDEFILLQTSLNMDYLKNLVAFNTNSMITNLNFYTAEPKISQIYSNEPIPLKEQYDIETSSTSLNEQVIECVKETVEVIGNPQESMWKKIFPKKSKEIVFKNTSNNCSFYVLIYIFQDKYKTSISVQSIKLAIWNGYKEFYQKYKEKILMLLRKQGKKNIVTKITSGKYSLESAIMSEDYYLTDLDIWMFSKNSKIQICLFSKNKLKGLDENLEWLIMGQSFREHHYFIRSPVIAGINKVPSYNLITPSYTLSELGEFENLVQASISGINRELYSNTQNINSFLEHI